MGGDGEEMRTRGGRMGNGGGKRGGREEYGGGGNRERPRWENGKREEKGQEKEGRARQEWERSTYHKLPITPHHYFLACPKY